MPYKKRKRLLVEPKVQGALAARLAVYWLACMVTNCALAVMLEMATVSSKEFYLQLHDMWYHLAIVALAGLLMLPMLIYDLLRMTNRFVGPIYRLRASLRALARGEQFEPIQFRKGDLWQEVAQEFNAALASVQHRDANCADGSSLRLVS